MNPLDFNQQFKTVIHCTIGVIIAIVIGWNVGSSNYIMLLFGAALAAAISFALFSGEFFWMVTIASSFLAGTFPILGGSFTPFQVLMALGVVKFLIGDIVLKRVRLFVPAGFELLLISGFMAVITWHGLHDRFGMRFLGSTVWGGRNYVNIYVGFAAFLVIQSIPMQMKDWAKLPYLILAVATFDLLIAIATTIFPSSIYTIFPFYSAVSRTGLEEVISGGAAETARLGPVGNFGGILIALVLTSTPLPRILSSPFSWRVSTLVIGWISVLLSSFRSALFNVIALFIVAGIRDLKLKVFALFPLLGVLLFSLSLFNSNVARLPPQVQRSLSFLPGTWDREMVQDAIASNDFRKQTWTLWTREYFPEHPLIGRGFGFHSEWATRSIYNPLAVDYRQMVEVGNVHNGFLACLDTFGIVGTIFFVMWNLSLLRRIFRVSFKNTGSSGRVLRFIALLLGASILCYWMGAPNVGTFLPQEFALAGVFLRLLRVLNLESSETKNQEMPFSDAAYSAVSVTK